MAAGRLRPASVSRVCGGECEQVCGVEGGICRVKCTRSESRPAQRFVSRQSRPAIRLLLANCSQHLAATARQQPGRGLPGRIEQARFAARLQAEDQIRRLDKLRPPSPELLGVKSGGAGGR